LSVELFECYEIRVVRQVCQLVHIAWDPVICYRYAQDVDASNSFTQSDILSHFLGFRIFFVELDFTQMIARIYDILQYFLLSP